MKNSKCKIKNWIGRRGRRAGVVFCIFNFAFLIFGLAGDVTVAWDASPTPGVTNYVLYAHTNMLTATNLASAVVKVNCGTNLSAAIEDLHPPSQWYLAATAAAGGVQSDLSNVLIVQVPVTPPNARVVAIQYGITLSNFVDAGFFRLRIPASTP